MKCSKPFFLYLGINTVGVLLSVIALAGYRYLPERYQIFFSGDAPADMGTYADIDFGGKSTVSMPSDQNGAVLCHIRYSKTYAACGLSIKYFVVDDKAFSDPSIPAHVRELDLTPYSRLRISFHYQGKADHIRFFLRNNEDRFDNIDQEKFMAAALPVKSSKNRQTIELRAVEKILCPIDASSVKIRT